MEHQSLIRFQKTARKLKIIDPLGATHGFAPDVKTLPMADLEFFERKRGNFPKQFKTLVGDVMNCHW